MWTGSSPVLNINLTAFQGDSVLLDVYEQLRDGGSDNTYHVFTPHKLPDRWHYKRSSRVGDLTLVGEQGTAFKEDFYPLVKK